MEQWMRETNTKLDKMEDSLLGFTPMMAFVLSTFILPILLHGVTGEWFWPALVWGFTTILFAWVIRSTDIIGDVQRKSAKAIKLSQAGTKALIVNYLVGGDATVRQGITPELRQYIIERDCEQCSYCGEQGDSLNGPDGNSWHIDHVVPVTRGGPTHADNLTLSCQTCNLRKRNKPTIQFMREMARRE